MTSRKRFEHASNPEILAQLLQDLDAVESWISAIPAVQLHSVPGRKPQNALVAQGDGSENLEALKQARDAMLQSMAAEAMPTGRWIRHDRELLYLTATPDIDGESTIYELYRLPASSARWISENTDEPPQVAERRAYYARWYYRVIATMGAILLGSGSLAVAAFLIWSSLASLALLIMAVLCYAGATIYMIYHEQLIPVLDDGGPHYPFDVIAPGTGAASPSLARQRENRNERARQKYLRKVAPEPKTALKKTHDYSYEYAGYNLGVEASCRVKIYQSEARRQTAPVIVLTQTLPPDGTSLTNLIEAVTAEVVVAEMPHLLPGGSRAARRAASKPPFRVVQHYAEGHASLLQGPGDGEATSIVTFADYRVQSPLGLPEIEHGTIGGEDVTLIRDNSTERPRLGEPSWHHVGMESARRLVGGGL